MCCNGAGVSTFFFKYVVQHFRARMQVVVWDYRGHGRSPPPPEPIDEADLGVERAAKDLAVVIRDVGVGPRVVLVGHSMGVQVVLESLLRQGGKADAIVSLFGTCGRPVDTFLDQPLSRPVVDALIRAAHAQLLGHGNAAKLLSQTLAEEEAADKKLTAIGERSVNAEALEAGRQSEAAS